jgi:cobalamin biosynthesis Mg chelatase CobN
MKTLWKLTVVLGCFAASTVFADTYNKKTKVTFSGPVQVPSPHSKTGVVTLPAGTYVFKLQDSSSQRHIVTITNLREDKVLSTVLAIPDYRVNATSKTVMYFSESKSGTPPPVKSWFYPGDNFGQRFVYPKVKAQEIAAQIQQPVPSHTAETIDTTTKVADVPVAIQTPAKQEVAYAPATFEKVDATDTAGVDGEAVKEAPASAERAAMPKTASPVHLFAILGVVLLLASFALRRAARQQ